MSQGRFRLLWIRSSIVKIQGNIGSLLEEDLRKLDGAHAVRATILIFGIDVSPLTNHHLGNVK